MFLDALNLTSFKVDSNSKNYSALDGILYNKDQSVLVKCPLKKEGSVTLPSSVKEIGPAAFACCYFITDVSLNDGLESIAEGAFLLTNLKRITADPALVYIPSGFGHAFLSLEENTVQYFAADREFVRGYAAAVSFRDPVIRLELPCESPVLSDKDRDAPFLDQMDEEN